MRSGYINLGVGYLRNAGGDGDNWSLSASLDRGDGAVAPSAYYIAFNAKGVNYSAGPYSRWGGFPRR